MAAGPPGTRAAVSLPWPRRKAPELSKCNCSTSTSQNGYHFRAVFTNRVGVATTSDGVLTVESDTSGGD